MSDMFDKGFDDGYADDEMQFPGNDDYVDGWNVGQEALEIFLWSITNVR